MSTVVWMADRLPCAERAPEPVDAVPVLELLRESILRAGSSQKAVAIDMGISAAQLSRQLSGIERLPVTQLLTVPRVLAEFGCLVAEHCGHRVRRTGAAERRAARIRSLQRELLALLDEDATDNTGVA